MARCEDCLHYQVCLDTEARHLRIILAGDTAERCKRFMLSADVVPKSEVKRVYYNLQAVLEERAETKQEIAREIFEEIEEAKERWEAIYSSNHFGYGGGAYGYLETDVDHTIYELKKKYTEEQ